MILIESDKRNVTRWLWLRLSAGQTRRSLDRLTCVAGADPVVNVAVHVRPKQMSADLLLRLVES